MIIGEIRRYLRDNSAIRVSRSMRDTAYKVLQVRERFLAENQREPTVEQIAKELDIPREEVVFAMDAIVDPVSLFEPVYADSGDTVCVMDIQCFNDGIASEQYLDKHGRTILWRRFNKNDWAYKRYGKLWTETLPQNEKLIINGETYVHWYDCITDYII